MMNYGTILVVDDNPAILTALKICLSDTFAHVRTLSQPEGILGFLSTEPVDVVLLDMNFSAGMNTGRDGLYWLQTLRAQHPDLPVVLMTAYAEVPLAVRGVKMGAADFIAKPWDNDELKRKLTDAIDARQEIVPLEQMEQEHIRKVMDRCGGNVAQAAKMLGITRQTLYTRLKR